MFSTEDFSGVSKPPSTNRSGGGTQPTMAVQQTTKDLTDSQQDKLVSLLKRIEAADSAQEAVWLDADGREDVREIRQAVEE